MASENHWCVDVMANKITWAIFGFVQICSYLVLIFWIRAQLRRARMGAVVTDHLLFPSHVNALWALALAEFVQGCENVVLPAFPRVSFSPRQPNTLAISIAYACGWGVYHFAIEGLQILLLQPGCGSKSRSVAFIFSSLWGIVTALTFGFVFRGHAIAGQAVNIVWEVTLLMFYGFIYLAPLSVFNRRPSAIYNAKFWTLFRLLMCVGTGVAFFNENASDCMYMINLATLFCFVKTYISYRALLIDTEWWQGEAVTPKEGSLLSSPLLGSTIDTSVARDLARQLDNLPSRVSLLNSAFLFIDGRATLGAGSFSKVFRGTWRGRVCAVKMVFTMDITPDVIASCFRESQLLARVDHPNVIKLYGVCVVPPSICIVLEFCSRGSLFNLIHQSGIRITWVQRLQIALGAARGIEAIHNANIVHKDIKSLNFLVHEKHRYLVCEPTAASKLSCVVSGIHQNNTNSSSNNSDQLLSGKHKQQQYNSFSHVVVADDDGDDEQEELHGCPFEVKVADFDASAFDNPEQLMSRFSHVVGLRRAKIPDHEQQQTQLDTINWLSPETLATNTTSNQADIFSLGMVFYEILSQKVPFDGLTRDQIRDNRKNNILPPITPSILSTQQQQQQPNPVPEASQNDFIELIKDMCQFEASARPTAKQIVVKLEEMITGLKKQAK